MGGRAVHVVCPGGRPREGESASEAHLLSVLYRTMKLAPAPPGGKRRRRTFSRKLIWLMTMTEMTMAKMEVPNRPAGRCIGSWGIQWVFGQCTQMEVPNRPAGLAEED